MMEAGTLISVVVPVYNAEKYLDICVGSILSQSYNYFELILVDDGSLDGSSDICDKYAKKDARVRVVHQANGGVSSARNVGIRVARGTYITFVDSDDCVDTAYLEKLLKGMADSDLSICSFYEVRAEGKTDILKQRTIRFPEEALSLKEGFTYLIQSGLLNPPFCKLFRKDIMDTHQLYFNQQIQLGEDLLFNLSYLKYCGTISFEAKPLYYYFKGSGSLSSQIKPDYADLQLQFYQRIQDLINMKELKYNQAYRQYNLLKDAIGSVLRGQGNRIEKRRAVGRVLQSGLLKEYLQYPKACTVREKIFRIILKTGSVRIVCFYFCVLSGMR